jgi:Arc/MetJ-type ribon-helix-helix transcriptional regulator
MPNHRKPNQTTATFVLQKHLLVWVTKEAESRGQSTSEYIRALLLQQWDKRQEQKNEKQK